MSIAYALRHDNVDGALRLMAEGEPIDEPDSRGNTPLHYAAGLDDVELVSALLAAGANPDTRNRRGRTPMHAAAKAGSEAVMHVLRDHGAAEWERDNALRMAPFDLAVAHNRIGAALFLLRIPGTWEFQVAKASGNHMLPPLHLAAAGGFGQMVEFLLSAGLDPLEHDEDGNTAAEVALQKGHAAIAARLREYEAARRATNLNGPV